VGTVILNLIYCNLLGEEEIGEIKKQDKSVFSRREHFGLGLFIRNHFGINSNKSKISYSDFLEKSNKPFFRSDDVSGYLLGEVWEEIQRRY
jgi:hypothetical protein